MITLPNSRFQGTNPKQNQSAAAAIPQQLVPQTQQSAFNQALIPSAGLLKALYLPSTRPTQPLRFAGGPSHQEMQGIIDSLTGWQHHRNIVGPTYFAEPNVVTALATHFTQQTPVPAAIVTQIAQHKAQVQNIHNLILGKPPVHPADLHDDAQAFTTELMDRMHRLNEVLIQAGVSPQARDLFNQYAAETAPLQYAMGFPDAVAHSADVAQLTFLQAKRHGATEPEELQVLMVGWLHDPKLPGAISWSNLATHPAIASSIAHHLLSQPDTHRALKHYLAQFSPSRCFPYSPCSSSNTKSFINGVVEALSINNDSKWIIDNVILHKATHTTLSEPGLADVREGLNVDDSRAIEQVFTNRFSAPSRGAKKLPHLSSRQLNQINKVYFSTDLRGINIAALQNNAGQFTITPEALRHLLNGEPNDQHRWNQARELIQAQPSKAFIINPKVKGGTLTSHHAEVKKGRLAALGLATADPLLLSPHKVIAQTKGDTVLDRLKSFLGSLDDNLQYLPQEAQINKPLWRKQVLESILASAQEVTGNQEPFANPSGQDLQAEGDALKAHLLEASTWGDFATMQPADNPPEFQRFLSTLKTNYEEAVRTKLMTLPSLTTGASSSGI